MNEHEKNILTVYEHASAAERSDGLLWYHNALAEAVRLSELFETPVANVVGAIALLSPGLRWELNISHARTLMVALANGNPIPMVGVYGRRNRDKAVSSLRGEHIDKLIVKSPKVKAFYKNILYPGYDLGYVTIDRHAQSIYNGSYVDTKAPSIHPALYTRIEQAYSNVATHVKILPHQLQATTWLTWRNLKDVLHVSEILK